MKSESELLRVKDFVDSSYNNFGNKLYSMSGGKYLETTTALGYCYKNETISSNNISNSYWIVCAETGNPELDLRVKMHEYGHIYLGHLDGIHEDLDRQAALVFRNNRDELIQLINEECGIDFADKLIESVIDDPNLNHSIHNIAMDMEVNSKILSKEDIEFMEKSLDEIYEKKKQERIEELIKSGVLKREDLEKKEDSENKSDSANDSSKEKLDEETEKEKTEAGIKLILPERYEFPDNLTYAEYFIESIKHLDKFVKMLVSLALGKNGDTRGIGKDQVKDMLDSLGGGMEALDELLEKSGMGNDSGNGTPSGQRKDSDFGPDNIDKRDHGSNSRSDADKKRESGELRKGIGNCAGGSVRPTNKNVDSIELAIEDVIRHYKKTVFKIATKKDLFYNFNRGISKKIIVPASIQRVTTSKKPSIVYLIDVSGSMDRRLIDRVLKTISKKMKYLNGGLHYDIITWNTSLCQHIRNIKPGKMIPSIHDGGGTRLAKGIEYFAKNYGPEAVLIIISDFEDYLEEWHAAEEKLNGYTIWGFNYGRDRTSRTIPWKNLKVKDLDDR